MEDIKKVLSSYKQRFISPRSISRTYFLTRLRPNHSIDLVDFNEKFGDNDNLLEQSINYDSFDFKKKSINIPDMKELLYENTNSSKKEVLLIFTNFTKKDFELISNYKKSISKFHKKITELEVLKESRNQILIETKKDAVITEDDDLEITDRDRESIIYVENIDEEIIQINVNIVETEKTLKSQINDFVEKYIKKLNKEFLSIEKLLKISGSYMKDFGKNDLYLGFPFIEGRFQSGKYFRAPLVLHRVEVNKTQNTVKLRIAEGESIINPVFLVSYHLENDLKHQMLKWDIESSDFITEAKSSLENLGIKYNIIDDKVDTFYSCTKREYKEKNILDYNEFSMKNNLVLGLFPISDKNIFNDLLYLEESTFENEDSITTFIKGNENVGDIFLKREEKRARENEIKYITQLDFSQKNVVKESLERNLVIEGPPGTGKSQVLSNIVANYVDRGKKVLVVSEKLAALEVVYNRIGNLSNNALLIRNHITDKTNFYNQVSKAISSIIVEGTFDTFKSFSELDKESEDVFDRLENRDKLYIKEYDGFTFEEILRYSNANFRDINKVAQFIDGIDTEGTRKDKFTLINKSINDIHKSGLFNSLKIIDQTLIQYQDIKLKYIKHYAEYLLNKVESENYNKILFYCSLNEIDIKNYEDYNYSVSSVKKTYKTLLEDVTNLIDSGTVRKYKEHLLESSNTIYKKLGIKKESIDLLKGWEKFSEKDRVIRIKQFKYPEFQLSLFKSFNPIKVLSKDEKDLYQLIDKSSSNLHPEKVLLNGLSKDLRLMLGYIVDNESDSFSRLSVDMFIKGLYQIDLGILENSFKEINSIESIIDYDDLKKIIDSQNHNFDLSVFAIMDSMLNREELINACSKYLVSKEYMSLKNDIEFYAEYDVIYKETLNNIDKKMMKSRISIENNLRREISLKGQTNPNFGRAVAELKRISLLKRKKSIAVITKKFTREILDLFPICLMTPGSVSATLENIKNLFDVVIFDEASQMFVEHAVPSIHRSKTIIVAGDSKQLRPSTFFSQRFTEDELEGEDLSFEVTAALEEVSLLDYCKNKYRSVNLRYHYRSDHIELIEFSNRAFYDNKLVFSSNITNHEKKPIELIDVAGEWIDNKNEIEAEKTVELIKNILKTRENNETIGVITFNSKQMDLIDDLLLEESYDNDDLAKELNRLNEVTGSDESLFVKNIENVQGDERDIIIFSVAYAKNEKGRFLNQFGPISQPNGENRLNVAITRAKKKIYLIKSIHSSVMNVREDNRGAHFFKKYLQYVEKLNNSDDIEIFLNQISDIEQDSEVLSDFDSPFEIEVFNAINKYMKGKYELRNQIKVGSFSIDLAIYDKEKEMFVLGIECDGAMYHSSKDAVENDFYRQAYLESRGWVIHRIWSTNWWNNKDLEVKKVISRIGS